MRYVADGVTYEIDPMRTKYGETKDAADALGVTLSSEDAMALHAINLWVAYHRANPDATPVQVTDWVRSLEFSVFASAVDDGSPLGRNGGSSETTLSTSGTQA